MSWNNPTRANTLSFGSVDPRFLVQSMSEDKVGHDGTLRVFVLGHIMLLSISCRVVLPMDTRAVTVDFITD
jgi:hypothetical protein